MSATHEYINSLILNHFKNKKISIVDYGCGNGDLLNFIDHKKISKYTGYDVSYDCLKVAKTFFQNDIFQFKKINKKKLPVLDDNLDLIVLIGVLQYMSEDETKYLFEQAKEKLSKNGVLIASCAVDHWIYRLLNIYQLFLPNRFINRNWILNQIKVTGLKPVHIREKGLLVAPLFSNIISFFFDAFDRVLLGTRGKIGPTGTLARKMISPLIKLEFLLPIDYGYTLYLQAKKDNEN